MERRADEPRPRTLRIPRSSAWRARAWRLLGRFRGVGGSSSGRLSVANSTLSPSERISLTSTLKLSGMPDSNVSSPRTIDFVDFRAAGDVVRFDGQHLLQRVGRAIGFERPNFHFAEALTAELRLAAERLLRDKAVRADRAGVDLVVDKMVELQHIDVAHRNLAVEGVAGAPVIERHLPGRIVIGEL